MKCTYFCFIQPLLLHGHVFPNFSEKLRIISIMLFQCLRAHVMKWKITPFFGFLLSVDEKSFATGSITFCFLSALMMTFVFLLMQCCRP